MYSYINNKNDCEEKDVSFKDEEKFKEYYNVLYTWDEIKTTILETYSNPIIIHKAKFNYINKKYHKKFSKLLADLKSDFYKQSFNAVKASLFYMFNKYKMGYYVRIRNNKLVLFCYLYNVNYSNPLSDKFKVPYYNSKIISKDKTKWMDLGSMIRSSEKKYEDFAIDFYYYQVKFFIQHILENYKIQDCDFIVSHKDRLTIKQDLTEASEEVVGSEKYPLNKKFKFKEYIPFLSFCYNKRYSDIPMPTPDDILREYNLFIPGNGNCKNYYIVDLNHDWNKKKNIAVFRGSFTGSSSHIRRNPRLHVSLLNNQWKYDTDKKLLDAGITNFRGRFRGRKEINKKYIEFLDVNYTKQLNIEPLDHKEQSYYKYVLYIEGNVAAYRGAYLFAFKSVVLWVESKKYYLWFEPHLKNKKNCIIIKHDLSNLKESIEWLQNNDDKAKEIAEEGYKLYTDILTKNGLEDYFQYLLNYI